MIYTADRTDKELVHVVYKRVKVTKEYCPNCLEQLSGNNSIAQPWECRCGTWHAVMSSTSHRMGYEIRPVPKT